MIATKTYYGEPGGWYFFDPAISNAQILMVSRENLVYHPTGNETVGDLEFVYTPAYGSITFDSNNPFAGPVGGDRPNRTFLEKIKVKYRI